MKKILVFWSVGLLVGWSADGALVATKFAPTAADAPFVERVDSMRAGYLPFETVFGADGKCISGCAYRGITLTEYVREIEVANAAADSDIAQEEEQAEIKPSPALRATPPPGPDKIKDFGGRAKEGNYTCANYTTTIAAGQKLPRGYPMQHQRMITSDFGLRDRPCAGCSEYHNAIDFSAPIGTPVFSTLTGTVSRANENAENSCGKYLMITGGKYKITLCHMSRLDVRGGDTVTSGCAVGLSGNTGIGTGAHLHYAITRDGTPVNPTRFL